MCTTFDLLAEIVNLARDWKRYMFGSLRGAIQLARIGATYISFIPILLISAKVDCYFLGESASQLYWTDSFPFVNFQSRPSASLTGIFPADASTVVAGGGVYTAYATGSCDLWGRTYLAVNATGFPALDGANKIFTQSAPPHEQGGWVEGKNGVGIYSLYGVLALANILTWAHAPHMTRGLPGLGWFSYLVNESLRDMRPFLTFSVLTLLAFSTGMYILSVGPDECGREDFGLADWEEDDSWIEGQECSESWIGRGFGGAVMVTFAWLFGNMELSELQQSRNIPMSYIFFFAFTLVTGVTCFNLLISILSETSVVRSVFFHAVDLSTSHVRRRPRPPPPLSLRRHRPPSATTKQRIRKIG